MNITTIKQVEVTTTIGIAPQLPQTVAVEFDNGIQTDLNMRWNPLSSEHYQKAGTYTIKGEIQLQEYTNPSVPLDKLLIHINKRSSLQLLFNNSRGK